jgi:transposase
MSSIDNTRPIEVITTVQKRRRWTTEEKIQLVRQSMEPGYTVSLVARQAGVCASQLFTWKRLYLEGGLFAVGVNESVVAASELKEAHNRIKQLERALGRKTLENEILKEAVDLAREKKWIARSPVLPVDDQ